ncbi:uncharacterized protein LOC114450898 isoform X2 [Parambassis ranga]|uniref:Uncharacterized protein LOC114429759 isoform X2 n=1 Tax=Parambassis ranga TaxID=210632 RepID=A0A6P7I0B1_9TELE|nr:uncharacterized protein LOC114429759 isoform X2 [Parambassis ranga]XP_028254455.1 uncharacterized protein LOC114430575 isoform X2 [Parambassis ranga]XP_028260704.1 uncharacterized protein LOC114435281 isoform X2 [Parambassis ranga]XP_028280636.1 uncharacterized protein LOC114448105 isoform X2 [Parambassis ranga]XP_028285129.1 uncharacterized protein LOC114450898 isoform X2 [Parambassis ranga]
MDEFVKTKLNEWQLDTLLDTFKEQEVDEESFLLLDDAAMQHLIPKIGQRLKFQKHHKELGAWYTPGRKHRPATGFLEERLRNVRKRMRSLIRPRQQEPQEDHAVLTPDSLSSPQNIREMVAWLKANKYPVSEVEAKMKETSIHRSKWIRCNGSKTISEILREFPRLTDNPGMISQDFQQLHPEAAGQMFEKWPAIADKILKYAQREGKINVVPDDVTPGERALKALPNLLPPSLFKRGGKIVRPTTAESQRAFVNMQPVGTNIVEYLTNVDNTFPHVLSLGHERVSQTFLVVEGHAIETDSLLEAVDLCFKSFYVFDTNYPKECQPTWEFLQHCIYEINGQESSAVKFLRTAIAHT